MHCQVHARRRRTHKRVNADSPSKVFASIAVIWLLLSSLRARDEATRQSWEAPIYVVDGRVAWTRASEQDTTALARKRPAASRASLATASPSVRALADGDAPEYTHDTRRIDRRADTHM